MRRTTQLIALLLCSLVALAAMQPPPPAAAAVDDPFTVKAGVFFNKATGKKAEQLRIVSQIEAAIDHAPAGSTIRIAQYLFDLDRPADKMIAAHKRGVRVQMLIDDGPATPQTTRVRKALGTDRTKGSYVAKCSRGCMSSASSVMHAKFFLFSQSGSSKTVSMISSANLYTGNAAGSWNNLHTVVGDAVMYASLNRYFDDMLKDKDTPNYYRTTSSGKHKMYFFPRRATPGTNQIAILDVLNHVKCAGVAPGYGSKGRTLVRVAHWGWSAARRDVAKRLWTLHDQGCEVQIIANKFKTSATILQTLLRPSRKHGVMGFYDAGIDSNRDGRGDKYMHHKVVTVSGVWFGNKATKVVYTGSANFTGPATHSNNDIILRVIDDRVYNSYASNLIYIRDNWTKRLTKAPVVRAAQAARQNAEIEASLDMQ